MKNYLYKTLIAFVLLAQNLLTFAYDFEVDGLCYNKLSNNQVEITYKSYEGGSYSGTLVIPSKVTYNGVTYNVTSIGNKAFYNCTGLTGSLSIPNSITNIGQEAFYNCVGLTGSLTIPNSVKTIKPTAFSGCSGFNGTLTIGSSVTSIGSHAFSYCTGLTGSLTIPNSVTIIDYSVFYKCSSFNGTLTIGTSVTFIGNGAFAYCTGLTGSLTIPNSVTTIDYGAFYNCSGFSGSLYIPNLVTNIGEWAFGRCSGLASITIPNSVTSIGNYAFYGCSGLTDVISEIQNPFEIEEDVFSSYTEATLTVPSGKKTKYQQTNYWNKFTNIVESSGGGSSTSRTIHVYPAGSLPDLISESEKYTIEELTLTGELNGTDFRLLRDMAGNNYLGQDTEGTLKMLDLSGAKVVAGGKKYVDTNSLPGWSGSYSLTVDKNDVLPEHVFHGCKFISIKIPNSVTNTGGWAFYGCNRMTSITIPNSVTTIGEYTFTGCRGLTSIMIPNSVAIIGRCAFSSCTGFTYITIPNSVTSVGNHAFSYCSGLASITIPNSVTSIGDGAFYECSGLTSITIPNSVTSIGDNAFLGCIGLTSIKVESGNTKYDSRNSCNALIETSSNILIAGCMNTTIPNSVTSIGHSAFSGCSGLTFIAIPNSVTSIDNHAFWRCSGLTSISIPNSVVSIGYSAFSGCRGISFITIPNSVVSIGEYAFDDCDKVISVTVDKTIPISITSNVFSNRKNATLYVPVGSKSAYAAADYWKEFKNIVEMSENVSLSISSNGNGIVTYNGTTVRNESHSFNVEKGTSVTITFTPDNGYRIKSVKVNSTNVTSSVSNNQYTISNITANTSLEVEFEAIPVTTYTLTIKATGNGSASYDGNTIRSKTSTFTVNEGASATIMFSSDNGYRIKSVKLNNTNVTSSVSNNQYTISNINANTTLEVEFEAIPVTTYTLSIKATGNGSASYDGNTVRSKTTTFTVNEGASATIMFSPDDGYRIKSVKVNSTNVTSSVSNNKYTISNITANTTLDVEFEAIPPTTYTFSVMATGGGTAYYDGTTIRNNTRSFTVNEGASATISFTPDNGYRIKSVKVNSTNVTSSVSNNKYTISNINDNTTLEVEFEAIPNTTYTLSIKATGNGSASYNGTAIRGKTSSFTVNEGASATITFSPDNGNSIASVRLNNSEVTSQVSGNRYTINNITANITLTVTFQEDVNALTVDGVNYTVVSQADRTVKVTGGDFGQVLTVPATVTQNGKTWTVTGIDTNALKNNTELAAVIWNPTYNFTATVSNPNLLLYVKAEQYAPSSIQNVVVNGTASNIVLKEASSGNDFYCPQAFVAQKISYTHNYQMQTGVGESKGWETIALPFDVQTITHETKGTIVPFAQWNNSSNKKPFWLMELTGTGFVEAGSIKAYTPYIISMPNNPQYDNQWLLKGKVTFAASSVTIGKTENLNQPIFNGRTFIPCFTERKADEGFYALNVNNDWETNNSGMTEGSKFVLNMRKIHPFEAYMTSSSNAAPYFDVFDDMTTGIQVMDEGRWMKEEVVYDLQGRKVENPSKKGVYIVNGKKKIIK